MYLAALQLSAMSQAAHTLASETRVVKQSLSLLNLGTGNNRIQRRTMNENTFLKETVILLCFAAVFFEQHETPFFNHSLFQYFLSDRDVNRQVDNIHKETIVQAR